MSRCRSNSCPVWGEREAEEAVRVECASVPGDLESLEAVEMDIEWKTHDVNEGGAPAMSHEESSALQVAALMEELNSLVRKNQELDMSLTQLNCAPPQPQPQRFPSRVPSSHGLNPMAAPFHFSDSSDHEQQPHNFPVSPMEFRGRYMPKRGSFSGSSQGCTPESSFCGEPGYMHQAARYNDAWRGHEMWQGECIPPYAGY